MNWKIGSAALSFVLLALCGCNAATPQIQRHQIASAALPTVDDSAYEILLYHLLHQAEDLRAAIAKQKSVATQEQNACLENEIALLSGLPEPHRKKSDPRADAKRLSDGLLQALDAEIQGLLDWQAFYAEHNRLHPSNIWPTQTFHDLLNEFCGNMRLRDCGAAATHRPRYRQAC